MKQYMQDRYIAAIGLLLTVGGLWLCTYYESDSALFPRICLCCIGFLLALLGVESFLTQKRLAAAGKSGETSLPMNWGPFLIVTLALAVYGAALVILGFYSSSIVFLLAVGFLWKGVKKPTIIIFTVCFQIFLYICFTVLFNVPLPKGFLI
ncbi:MAG: tripartite tricarboxylate transporter TctB family protein [Deltaproteobacteria bacterium]|nr:tripartite tricarboxylate transporter TctB family protein [Deltaproteobacteria bacterium]